MASFDTIVLGLGAMGSAALYHLARRGVRALGIDRFSPPHAFGSSHGDTRITRLAIGEGEHYTPLALRSHELWRELEAETGDRLLTACGGLVLSSGSATSHTHVENFFDNTLAAARRFGIAHELLDAAEIRRRFPPFRVADAERGYLERDAGFLRPERCIAAHLRAARRGGASLRCNERAGAIHASSSGVSVTTEQGVYSAASLIVAAGAWLPALVGGSIARHFAVYRQTLSWFEIEGDAKPFGIDRCPVFIWELTGRPQSIYGFPAVDGAAGGVKIASERFDRPTDPDALDRDVSGEEVSALHRDYVAPYVAGVGSRCLKSLSCLYTVTPDFGFVLDRLPGADCVLVASPCSGHGFKHSPAIGEALAAMACDAAPRFDLSPFALGRFAARG
jgi:sarcosine oxidase